MNPVRVKRGGFLSVKYCPNPYTTDSLCNDPSPIVTLRYNYPVPENTTLKELIAKTKAFIPKVKKAKTPEPTLANLDQVEIQPLTRLDVIKENPPITKAELLEVIEDMLGSAFKQGIVMAEHAQEIDHKVPIDWLYEIWCIAWGRTDDGKWTKLTVVEISRINKPFLIHGPRGGMKTLALAALWFLLCWYIDGYTVTHSATQKHQAQQCREYVSNWATHPQFSEKIKGAFKGFIEWHSGSSLLIVTASMDGFNAPHTLSMSLDEVETLSKEFLDQAMQIPQEMPGYPYPSIVVLASTQKKPKLGMSRLIKAAIKFGDYRYIMWNVFDISERCTDERRVELIPHDLTCSDYPVIQEAIKGMDLQELLTPVEHQLRDALKEKKQALINNCPLVIDCHGRNIKSTGHLSINTQITRIKTLDRITWVAENLCLEPGRKNTVYEMLSSENKSLKAAWREAGRTVVGIDYGFIDKTWAVMFSVHGIFVDVCNEYIGENMFEEDLIPVFEGWQRKYAVDKWIVGKDAKKLYVLMRKAGMDVRLSSRQRVLKGCDHVAKLICDGTGTRRMRFHPEKAYETYEQMSAYEKKVGSADPKDGDDDGCDAVRYGCEDITIRIGKKRSRVQRPRRVGRTLGKKGYGRHRKPNTRRFSA